MINTTLKMTVKDCKPGDASCAQDMDPFLSQDSENLLGRVLAGMHHYLVNTNSQ